MMHVLLFPQCLHEIRGVLCGSLLKCLTRYPGELDSTRTGFSRFFRQSVHGERHFKAHSLILVKAGKNMNNVSFRRDMTEILLKAAKNTNPSILKYESSSCFSKQKIMLCKKIIFSFKILGLVIDW